MLKNMRNMLQQFSEKLTYRHWLIIAGTVSCVLGILVYLSLGSNEPPPTVITQEQRKTVWVLAAKKDIQPRAFIQESMITSVELPENVVPEGALSDIKSVINTPAAVIILKGDIITKQKIMTDPKQAGFVGIIPPDRRAISIGISDVTGVAGFASAGDYVDVMVVTGRKEEGRIIGKMVLQNILLLGINKSGGGANEKPVAEQKETNNTNAVKANKEAMATATLALTPDEALKLATTAQNGIVYLALRPYKPKDEVVVTHDYVVHTERAGDQRKNAPSGAPSGRYSAPVGGGSVEVIRGTTATREGGR